MVNTNYIKAGRLVRILRGPRADKVCVIKDIVDSNRIIVENPEDSKCWTHIQSLKNVEPLKFSVAVRRGAPTKDIKTALAEKKTLAKWSATKKARGIAATAALENSNDFERYQLRVAKRSKAHWARKLFDEADSKEAVTWHKKTAKKLQRAHKKYSDKKLKERHDRIKKFFTAKKAKKAAKGKKAGKK